MISPVDLVFNFALFKKLEIDLQHINQGRLKLRQTKLTADDVTYIAMTLINNDFLHMSGKREFGEEHCTYFAKEGCVEGKKYRIIFCVCSDQPKAIGIITLFRVG